MSPENKERLRTNLAALHKMASAWAITATGALGTFWLSLPPGEQRALVDALPLPVWAVPLVPLVLAVVGLAARVWPQKNILAHEAAAKSAAPDSP